VNVMENEVKKEVKVREITIFDGNEGWVHNDHMYRLACAVQIVQAPDGSLIAGWMTGGNMEPADDHIAVCARSYDGGETWSEPEVLVGEGKENGAASLFEIDGRLYQMASRWEDNYGVWKYVRRESLDNGKTWVNEVPIKLIEGEGLSSSFGNFIRLQNGELMCAVNTMTLRDKPLQAGVERLVYAKNEEEAAAMAPRTEDETHAIWMDKYIYGMATALVNEDLTEFTPLGGFNNRPLGLLEGQIIQLKNGNLAMIVRAEWGGFLWRSDSTDNGRTWCDAYPLDIPNPSTLATVLRLPDGRIALFHNAIGEFGKKSSRNRLSIWVSNDEMESWYIKTDVIFGGQNAYPCPYILKDGRIVFTYDKDRRLAKFVEVTIPD